ncbi:hypothetical protein L1987_48119 [Smallanthus sonchifolius]|uniref:Uncharacterized protein n=1 Tax=Smallanthus sonchifolius TaxID=185202 RepID=A0ACB9FQG5_9ASTR|nr:hypothetical protein L1987_48119 [Smallanthus sonchifolius]
MVSGIPSRHPSSEGASSSNTCYWRFPSFLISFGLPSYLLVFLSSLTTIDGSDLHPCFLCRCLDVQWLLVALCSLISIHFRNHPTRINKRHLLIFKCTRTGTASIQDDPNNNCSTS